MIARGFCVLQNIWMLQTGPNAIALHDMYFNKIALALYLNTALYMSAVNRLNSWKELGDFESIIFNDSKDL